MYSETQDTTKSNTSKLSNILEIKIISTIIYLVSILVIAGGIIISYSGLASVYVAPTYINLLGTIIPAVLVMIPVLKKIPAHVYIIMAALVLSMTAAIKSFFDVIAYSKNGNDGTKGGFGAASAGAFFIFAGEVGITVASFFTFFGIL